MTTPKILNNVNWTTDTIPRKNYKTSITKVKFRGNSYPIPNSLSFWFYGCTNLSSIKSYIGETELSPFANLNTKYCKDFVQDNLPLSEDKSL